MILRPIFKITFYPHIDKSYFPFLHFPKLEILLYILKMTIAYVDTKLSFHLVYNSRCKLPKKSYSCCFCWPSSVISTWEFEVFKKIWFTKGSYFFENFKIFKPKLEQSKAYILRRTSFCWLSTSIGRWTTLEKNAAKYSKLM